MPQIRTYTNPIDKIEPSTLGSQAWESAGYHLDRLISSAGEKIASADSFAGASITKGYAETSNALREAGQTFSEEMAATAKMTAQAKAEGMGAMDAAQKQAKMERDQQETDRQQQIRNQADEFNISAMQRQEEIDNQASQFGRKQNLAERQYDDSPQAHAAEGGE